MKNNEAIHFQVASNDAALLETKTRILEPVFNMKQRMHLFANQLSKIVEFDSFCYENQEEDVSVSLGYIEAHRCSYAIENGGVNHGQFTLTRNAPFSEEELMIIETAMSSIIHTCHL